MQLLEVQPKQGYVWFRQGIWLFRRNPFTFLMLLFLYVLTVQMAIFIPLLGMFAILLLSPCFAVGFMNANRAVIRSERVLPTVFLDGFRRYGQGVARNLLKLGLIYAVAILLLSLTASAAVDFQKLLPYVLNGEKLDPEAAQQLYFALALAAVLYLPVAMLMWFAPLLVAWDNQPPLKAMFFSWIACWRNRGAFACYLLIWASILIVMPLLIEGALDSIGADNMRSFIITPWSMIWIAIFYCSFYATWKGCFQDGDTAAA